MLYQEAKKIMGQNCIGPDDLAMIVDQLPLVLAEKIPQVPFTATQLKKYKTDFILILGCPKDKEGNWLTLNRLRELFGTDQNKNEPCFYNQDWYLREAFASKTHLKLQWYLIRKNIIKDTQGRDPRVLAKKYSKSEQFPTAILTAYTFFVYFLARNHKILWKHDFLWCQDQDHNGDQIYTGRYLDPAGVNKNGFNIHRHLSIRKTYAVASQII